MSMRRGFRRSAQRVENPSLGKSVPALETPRLQRDDGAALRFRGSWGNVGPGVLMLFSACLVASGCSDSGDAAAYHTAVEKKPSTADAGTETASEQAAEPERDVAVAEDVATAGPQDVSQNGDGAATSTDATVAPDGTNAEGSAPRYEVLVKQKDFKKDSATDALRVTYDDLDLLKVLNMKQATAEAPELMPQWMKNLDGKRVRIRGFMHPQSVFQDAGIARFVFCRDTGVCCFGPNPTIYYLIEVTMKKGATTHYIDNRPFDVVGTFRIQLSQIKETGEIFQLYHINDAEVIER